MFFYGKTDKGRMRPTNQDNFLTMRLADNLLMLVLCDGMGGTSGGNIASSLAGRTYSEFIENAVEGHIDENGVFDPAGMDIEGIVRDAVVAANRAVYARARENSELANMGTTLVSALVCDGMMYIANVGDSRMYMYYNGELTQLTHDHSYVQMLVDMGMITKEEAATNPRRNILTRAVGTEKIIEVDITRMELPKNNAYFLLCSDGLYNFLYEKELIDILERDNEIYDDDYEADLAYRTEQMIDAANDNGGGDNITTILVRIPDRERE
ncbi:MAG: Stp1/IreP family PP2C-type Ser/Thr phosphatase [Clostridia bacterium]|nr:Stp1/IreP family PP2C-type Ser/Thr phosphatase [Clostridia bacterium]